MRSNNNKKIINSLACDCGQVCIELQGAPISVTECLCKSCREAAVRISSLPGAKNILTAYGATGCAEYRKDKVAIIAGQ